MALVPFPFPDFVGVAVWKRGLTEHGVLIGDFIPCRRPVLDGQGRVYSPLRVMAWRLRELEHVRNKAKVRFVCHVGPILACFSEDRKGLIPSSALSGRCCFPVFLEQVLQGFAQQVLKRLFLLHGQNLQLF